MIRHIYPLDQPGNGISVYGHQIDELVGPARIRTQHDVAHVELGYTGSAEFWTARRLVHDNPTIKLVLTLHDPPVVCGKPFERFIPWRNTPAKSVRKALDLTIGRALTAGLMRRADALVVLNPLASPALERAYRLDASKIHTLPLLPSLSPPDTYASPVGRDHMKVLFFGNLSPRKGVRELVEAFAILAIDFPGATLTVAGKDDGTGFAASVQKRIAELELDARVTLSGFVDDAGLARLLSASDIVVLPYQDPGIIHASGPLTTAMAFGKAVVASHIPVFEAELADGDRGTLYAHGDTPGLAEALRSYLSDPALAERHGHAAYRHIHDDHAPGIIKTQLTELYRSL